MQTAYARATEILTTNLKELHDVAQALLEYEMLSGDEIKALLRGEKITRDNNDEPINSGPRSSVPSSGGGMGNVGTQGV